MILLGVVSTSVFAIKEVQDNDGETGPDYVSINMDSYWGMVGFAFFMLEGIGCLMPVMRETQNPEQMPLIAGSALVLLGLVYTSFSSICYYSWGSDLTEPVVTEMLPADNTFVQVMKLLFCLNLVFSYPITIVPSLNTLENIIFGKKETA